MSSSFLTRCWTSLAPKLRRIWKSQSNKRFVVFIVCFEQYHLYAKSSPIKSLTADKQIRLVFDDNYRIIFFYKNIFCTYLLESSDQRHSNEYPQCILYSEIWNIILSSITNYPPYLFLCNFSCQWLRISQLLNIFLLGDIYS